MNLHHISQDNSLKRRINKGINNLSQIPSQNQEHFKNLQSDIMLKSSFQKSKLNKTKTEKKLSQGRILNLFYMHKMQIERKIMNGIFSKEYDITKKISSTKEIDSSFQNQIFGPKVVFNVSNKPEIIKNDLYCPGKKIFSTPTNQRDGANSLKNPKFSYIANGSDQNVSKFAGKIININTRTIDENDDNDCNIDEEEDKGSIKRTY